MKQILVSNVEKWLIPHIRTIGEILHLQRMKTRDFDLFSPDIPFIVGFENILDLSEVGLLADMLHLAIKAGKIKKIVYLSSYSVYSPKVEKYTESDLIFPMNSIGVRAAILENALTYFSYRYEIDTTILRLFNPYGPFQTPPYIIPSILESAISKNTIKIGDLEKTRDFIYITDLLEVISRVLKSNKNGVRIYNVGSGQATSVKELIRSVQKVTKKKLDVIFDATRLREEYDYDYVVADVSKIKKELDWESKIDLETGLLLTYQWTLGRSGNGV